MRTATAMTLAAILMPDWVSYSVTANTGATFTQKLGLHRSCSSEFDPPCRPFPERADCLGDERQFCSMWRTTGFLMSFAAVAELATLVGFLVIMMGGKMKREAGWKIVVGMLAIVAAILLAAMSIVVCFAEITEELALAGNRTDGVHYRPTSSTTTRSSSYPGGNWTSHGFFVSSVAA